MLKVGMLTSGGDCQALNAAMRGVAKSLYRAVEDVEIIGFEEGYKGLIYGDFKVMKKVIFRNSYRGRHDNRKLQTAF